MTEQLQQMLDAAYALRWVLVVAGFITLGALYALALGQLAAERAWSMQLEEESASDRSRYRAGVPAEVSLDDRLGEIVALPPRQEAQR